VTFGRNSGCLSNLLTHIYWIALSDLSLLRLNGRLRSGDARQFGNTQQPSRRNKLNRLPSPIQLFMSLYWQIGLVVLIVISAFSISTKRERDKGRQYLFPPGPKGLPIVGNGCQLPHFGVSAPTKKNGLTSAARCLSLDNL